MTHPNHHLGPGLGSEHAEDAGSTSHVQHHFVLEQVLVVEHRIAIGEGAHLVFQHLLKVVGGGWGMGGKQSETADILSVS